jgi:hypothetical protein
MHLPREDEFFGEEHILEVRLENGMGQLKTLQELISLEFSESAPDYIPYSSSAWKG